MGRISIVTSAAIILLGAVALVDTVVPAQERTLRQQLIGPWDLVSCENKLQPICSNPGGSYVFTESGRYMVVLIEKGQPQKVMANFGIYAVDEASKTITLHPEGALFSGAEASEIKVNVSVNGDELRNTGNLTGNSIWHRHGPASVLPVSQTK